MRDPERIIHGSFDDDAARLMKSVRGDAPSTQARARTLAALGLPATFAVASKAAGATAWFMSSKVLVMGSLVGVSLAAGVVTMGLRLARPVTPTMQPPVKSARTTDSTRVYDPPVDAPRADVQASASEPVAPTSSLNAEHNRVPNRATAAAPAVVRAASQLSKEVIALDAVRAAALTQNHRLVLALLDAYQREFPRGVLGPEAQVLRVEALAASGQWSQAHALAQRLLASDPAGPLSERVRAAAADGATPERGATNFRSKPVPPITSK